MPKPQQSQPGKGRQPANPSARPKQISSPIQIPFTQRAPAQIGFNKVAFGKTNPNPTTSFSVIADSLSKGIGAFADANSPSSRARKEEESRRAEARLLEEANLHFEDGVAAILDDVPPETPNRDAEVAARISALTTEQSSTYNDIPQENLMRKPRKILRIANEKQYAERTKVVVDQANILVNAGSPIANLAEVLGLQEANPSIDLSRQISILKGAASTAHMKITIRESLGPITTDLQDIFNDFKNNQQAFSVDEFSTAAAPILAGISAVDLLRLDKEQIPETVMELFTEQAQRIRDFYGGLIRQAKTLATSRKLQLNTQNYEAALNTAIHSDTVSISQVIDTVQANPGPTTEAQERRNFQDIWVNRFKTRMAGTASMQDLLTDLRILETFKTPKGFEYFGEDKDVLISQIKALLKPKALNDLTARPDLVKGYSLSTLRKVKELSGETSPDVLGKVIAGWVNRKTEDIVLGGSENPKDPTSEVEPKFRARIEANLHDALTLAINTPLKTLLSGGKTTYDRALAASIIGNVTAQSTKELEIRSFNRLAQLEVNLNSILNEFQLNASYDDTLSRKEKLNALTDKLRDLHELYSSEVSYQSSMAGFLQESIEKQIPPELAAHSENLNLFNKDEIANPIQTLKTKLQIKRTKGNPFKLSFKFDDAKITQESYDTAVTLSNKTDAKVRDVRLSNRTPASGAVTSGFGKLPGNPDVLASTLGLKETASSITNGRLALIAILARAGALLGRDGKITTIRDLTSLDFTDLIASPLNPNIVNFTSDAARATYEALYTLDQQLIGNSSIPPSKDRVTSTLRLLTAQAKLLAPLRDDPHTSSLRLRLLLADAFRGKIMDSSAMLGHPPAGSAGALEFRVGLSYPMIPNAGALGKQIQAMISAVQADSPDDPDAGMEDFLIVVAGLANLDIKKIVWTNAGFGRNLTMAAFMLQQIDEQGKSEELQIDGEIFPGAKREADKLRNLIFHTLVTDTSNISYQGDVAPERSEGLITDVSTWLADHGGDLEVGLAFLHGTAFPKESTREIFVEDYVEDYVFGKGVNYSAFVDSFMKIIRQDVADGGFVKPEMEALMAMTATPNFDWGNPDTAASIAFALTTMGASSLEGSKLVVDFSTFPDSYNMFYPVIPTQEAGSPVNFPGRALPVNTVTLADQEILAVGTVFYSAPKSVTDWANYLSVNHRDEMATIRSLNDPRLNKLLNELPWLITAEGRIAVPGDRPIAGLSYAHLEYLLDAEVFSKLDIGYQPYTVSLRFAETRPGSGEYTPQQNSDSRPYGEEFSRPTRRQLKKLTSAVGRLRSGVTRDEIPLMLNGKVIWISDDTSAFNHHSMHTRRSVAGQTDILPLVYNVDEETLNQPSKRLKDDPIQMYAKYAKHVEDTFIVDNFVDALPIIPRRAALETNFMRVSGPPRSLDGYRGREFSLNSQFDTFDPSNNGTNNFFPLDSTPAMSAIRRYFADVAATKNKPKGVKTK